MHQLDPREDGSGGHIGTRSGIIGQDLMCRSRRADVLTPGDPGCDGAPRQ